MGKFCAIAVRHLAQKQKYCGKCGTKVPQVQVESDSIELSSNSEQSSVQSPMLEIEKANSVTAKESVSKLSQEAKKRKGTNIMNEAKILNLYHLKRKKAFADLYPCTCSNCSCNYSYSNCFRWAK